MGLLVRHEDKGGYDAWYNNVVVVLLLKKNRPVFRRLADGTIFVNTAAYGPVA